MLVKAQMAFYIKICFEIFNFIPKIAEINPKIVWLLELAMKLIVAFIALAASISLASVQVSQTDRLVVGLRLFPIVNLCLTLLHCVTMIGCQTLNTMMRSTLADHVSLTLTNRSTPSSRLPGWMSDKEMTKFIRWLAEFCRYIVWNRNSHIKLAN